MIELKQVLTIERIKDVVGEIMSSCRGKLQFELLECIMARVLFGKKIIRQSFMQEALNASEQSSYRVALQNYINQNHFKIYRSEQNSEVDDWSNEDSDDARDEGEEAYERRKSREKQRIIEFSWVDLSNALAVDDHWNDVLAPPQP